MERNKSRAFLGLSIIFFLVVGATAYYKENGLADVGKLHLEIASVKNQIQKYYLENNNIRRALVSLNKNDDRVEAIAREQLGLVKPGEVVYEFIDAGKLAKGEL
ncbi:Cell division protein DivIC (FtsB), stabilizes FtsL against RasP cleavage [hydrothermal vent metagenome]|uniref:Cell division protein DivIC (FtsB), stabilizes FtsL against RasP cleavage n=1 Tax=hydrothermal vent metagenome TaxID=652676 RepID=A0A3B1BXD4_9ZZZZ